MGLTVKAKETELARKGYFKRAIYKPCVDPARFAALLEEWSNGQVEAKSGAQRSFINMRLLKEREETKYIGPAGA
jgi:hypothetical protein